MKKAMLTLALPLAAVVVSFATTSHADDVAPPATTTTTTQMTTTPLQPGAQPFVSQPQVVQPTPPVAVAPPAYGTTTTTAAPYAPYAPTGQRYESTTEHRPNRALLSTGTGLFVLSYAPSIVAAAVSGRDEDKRLFIPVVGPWLDLGQRDCNARPCGGREDLNKAMIITSGIAQGAGVLLAISSLFIPETVETKTTVSSAAATKPTVRVTPVTDAAGGGIGAVGRF
jgi:hypothetical protein